MDVNNIKGMSYGILLSHTFPGLLLEIELLLYFRFFTGADFFPYLFPDKPETGSTSRLLLTLGGMFIVATILGITIDALHHSFSDLWRYKIRKCVSRKTGYTREDDFKIYRYIKNQEQVQIYTQFVDDDLHYYWEAYANIAIVMIFGSVLLAYGLFCRLKCHWVFGCFMVIIYLAFLISTICQVVETRIEIDEMEKSLEENFKSCPDGAKASKNE